MLRALLVHTKANKDKHKIFDFVLLPFLFSLFVFPSFLLSTYNAITIQYTQTFPY